MWRGDDRNREDRKRAIYGYHLTRESGGVITSWLVVECPVIDKAKCQRFGKACT